MDSIVLFLYFPLFLVLYAFTHYLLHKLQNLPPTPFPILPLIGHFHLLKEPLHRSLAKLSDRYGPILVLQFGSRRVLLVSSSSVAEECLTTNDVHFANRPRLLFGKHLGFNFTSMAWAPYGDHWRNLRRIASLELLSSHRLQTLSQIRLDEARALVRRLFISSSANPHQAVNLKSAFFELAFNVMMGMIAGKRYCGENVASVDEAERFKELVNESLILGSESGVLDFLPLLRWVKFKGYEKRMIDVQKKRDEFVQDLIEEHRKVEADKSSGEKKKTLILILLSLSQLEPEHYTDETIKSLSLGLFQGGTDTTSRTIEQAMSQLLSHKEILMKAQAEIDNNVGHDRLMKESDVAELLYLRCIIKETLRMYPPAPLLLPHESSRDCIVGGFRVPHGTMIFVNVWAIQNDSKIWVDPGNFKPERFEGHEGGRDGFEFIPFGAGRRGCPGEGLAMRMIGLVLGLLIQCFDWQRASHEMVDMKGGTGLVFMAQPLMAECQPREAMVNLLPQI